MRYFSPYLPLLIIATEHTSSMTTLLSLRFAAMKYLTRLRDRCHRHQQLQISTASHMHTKKKNVKRIITHARFTNCRAMTISPVYTANPSCVLRHRTDITPCFVAAFIVCSCKNVVLFNPLFTLAFLYILLPLSRPAYTGWSAEFNDNNSLLESTCPIWRLLF